MAAPVERKVQAGSLAAALSGAALWALQTYVFKTAVPAGVESLIYAAVPGAIAWTAGYLAPHTPRPALQPPPPAEKTMYTPPAGSV
jgi:hypothetical protein